MQKLVAFLSLSLDGYFADDKGDMSWAHKSDPEWREFVEGNAASGGTLLFGRRTYQMMAGYWPTPMAIQQNPSVATGMNSAPKVVFSRKLKEAAWQNTRVMKGKLPEAVKGLKEEQGAGLCILGSGEIVSQLLNANLIDELQIVIFPVVLGSGRNPFELMKMRQQLTLTKSRAFGNGNVVLWYDLAVSEAGK